MERITLSNDGRFRAPHGTIGNCIAHLRKERGWTQVQLAKRIYVTQSAIASYESGRVCPSVKRIQLLAMEFNVPVEFILAHRRSLFSKEHVLRNRESIHQKPRSTHTTRFA